MAIINNTWNEIADALKQAQTVLVFTHQKMDGDATGSSCALTRVLRLLGKTCYVLIEDDEVPDTFRFLDEGYMTTDEKIIETPDVCICVDASQLTRFPRRSEKFRTGKTTICVDHHLADEPFCDYHYVDPDSAAASVLVFHLINALGAEIDRKTAALLYAGIMTDTGNFQYSNTNADALRAAASLVETGLDVNSVCVPINENVSEPKMRLKAEALTNMEFFAEGRLVMTRVTQEMLKRHGAKMIDAEGIVADLRSIKGVEIAILLKEDIDKVFGSLRAKSDGDVQTIASQFGGGGHVKASGCTLRMTLQEAWTSLRDAALKSLE